MKRRIRFFMILAAGGILCQCGCRQVEMYFEGYRSRALPFPPTRGGQTVAVAVGTEPAEPLLEAEVAAKISYLLREQGYRVKEKAEATYLLSCWFGMDPAETFSGVMPIYEPGKVISTPVRTRRGHWRSVHTYLPGSTHYVPYSYTVYPKFVSLTLHDNELWAKSEEDTHAEAVIWRGTSVNADESTDLRWRLNHLLLACFKYWGQETIKQQRIWMGEEAEPVKELTEAIR